MWKKRRKIRLNEFLVIWFFDDFFFHLEIAYPPWKNRNKCVIETPSLDWFIYFFVQLKFIWILRGSLENQAFYKHDYDKNNANCSYVYVSRSVRAIRKEKVIVVAQISVAAFAFDVWTNAELNFTSVISTTANKVIANSCSLFKKMTKRD